MFNKILFNVIVIVIEIELRKTCRRGVGVLVGWWGREGLREGEGLHLLFSHSLIRQSKMLLMLLQQRQQHDLVIALCIYLTVRFSDSPLYLFNSTI